MRNLHSFHMLILPRSLIRLLPLPVLDHMGQMGLLKEGRKAVGRSVGGHKPNLFLLLHLFLSSFTSPQRQRIGREGGGRRGVTTSSGETGTTPSSSFRPQSGSLSPPRKVTPWKHFLNFLAPPWVTLCHAMGKADQSTARPLLPCSARSHRQRPQIK